MTNSHSGRLDPSIDKPRSSKAKEEPGKGGEVELSVAFGSTTGSFKHIAHLGYDSGKGTTSPNVNVQPFLECAPERPVEPWCCEGGH